MTNPQRIVVFCGGIGGTKLAEGLAALLPPARLSFIGNVGDDDEFHGLWVSPDIDILTCTLAGLINQQNGWGLANDSFQTLEMLKTLGSNDTWMNLGDRDLALHIYRTQQRHRGVRPFLIATDIARKLGVHHPVLLPTDDPLGTRIRTPQGWLPMETYFVRERCQPPVLDIDYSGKNQARATPEVLAALSAADLILFAPSNPLVSIGPILATPGIAEAVRHSGAPKVAMAPLVNNQAIKGPTCDMMRAMGFSPDLAGVASFYEGLIDTLVIDTSDDNQRIVLEAQGLNVISQNILMKSTGERIQVADHLLQNLGVNTQSGIPGASNRSSTFSGEHRLG